VCLGKPRSALCACLDDESEQVLDVWVFRLLLFLEIFCCCFVVFVDVVVVADAVAVVVVILLLLLLSWF
jgi:hypothetical protein